MFGSNDLPEQPLYDLLARLHTLIQKRQKDGAKLTALNYNTEKGHLYAQMIDGDVVTHVQAALSYTSIGNAAAMEFEIGASTTLHTYRGISVKYHARLYPKDAQRITDKDLRTIYNRIKSAAKKTNEKVRGVIYGR